MSEKPKKPSTDPTDDTILYLGNDEFITVAQAKQRIFLQDIVSGVPPKARHGSTDDSIVIEDEGQLPQELVDF